MGFLNDKQSITLCVIMVAGIFISGILDILNNFAVLTFLTLVFFTIILNLILSKRVSKEEQKENDSK